MTTNTPYPIPPEGNTYVHISYHRNGWPEKSQWIISELCERDCCSAALIANWSGASGAHWGLHFSDAGSVAYLGTPAQVSSHDDELFIAKFVDDTGTNCWHGYPADHRRTPNDIPPGHILEKWRKSGLLPLQKTGKITRGQRCKL